MEKMELPAGFRFVPNDHELIGYLRKKTCNHEDANIITEYDISKCNPDQIPRSFKYGLANESFYYTQTKPRHSKGQRRDRKAGNGSWRVTCGSRPIKNACGDVVGYKKKLVFLEHLEGRKKRKTEWMMDEYSIQDMNNYALCRIYCKENRRLPAIPNDVNSTEDPTERSEVDASEGPDEINSQSIISPQQPPNLRDNKANSFVESFPCHFDFGLDYDLDPFWPQDCPEISSIFSTAQNS